MGIVFLLCCGVIVLLAGRRDHPSALVLQPTLFRTGRWFNVFSCIILAILVCFYALWW